jgi:hypothetical protein
MGQSMSNIVGNSATSFVALYILVQIGRRVSNKFDGTYFTISSVITAVFSPLIRPLTSGANLPKNLQSLKPNFFSQALQKCGAIQNSKVTKAVVVPFAAGQTSDCARVTLTYDRNETSNGVEQPESIVVKMSREDTQGRVLNMMLGLWRECQFYAELSDMIPSEMVIPKSYFTYVNSINNDFILLLSDATIQNGKKMKAGIITPPSAFYGVTHYIDERPDPTVPPPEEISTIIVPKDTVIKAAQSIAAMHAKFWGDKKLLNATWASLTTPTHANLFGGIYAGSWPKTKKLVSEHYANWKWRGEEKLMVETVDQALAYVVDPEKMVLNRPFGYTLCHGDFHGQNILRVSEEDGSDESLVYLDWQVISVGEGIRDVAYMIMQTCPPYYRRKREKEIVRVWYDELIKKGVDENSYPFELAWSRYKFWCIVGWCAILGLTSSLKRIYETPQGPNAYIYSALCDMIIDAVQTHGSVNDNLAEAYRIVEEMKNENANCGGNKKKKNN